MLRKIFIGTMLLAAMTVGVTRAQSNTASANISAELSLPISIYSGFADLHFGGFMPGASAGTVTVPANPISPRTADGGVVLVTRYSGFAGRLLVEGNPLATYELTLPTDPITLNGNNSATMTLTDITTFTDTGLFSLDEFGNQYVYIGAKLSVGANQEQGGYSGQFTITANYL